MAVLCLGVFVGCGRFWPWGKLPKLHKNSLAEWQTLWILLGPIKSWQDIRNKSSELINEAKYTNVCNAITQMRFIVGLYRALGLSVGCEGYQSYQFNAKSRISVSLYSVVQLKTVMSICVIPLKSHYMTTEYISVRTFWHVILVLQLVFMKAGVFADLHCIVLYLIYCSGHTWNCRAQHYRKLRAMLDDLHKNFSRYL